MSVAAMQPLRSIAPGLLAGVAIRVYVACGLDGKSWNDAAVVGLMAMHELKGKFYTFFWGQSYMGSLESLSIAPFFALFGVSDLSLYLGLLPWYVFFTIAIYFVARECGGERAGTIAVLLSAFGSPYLLYHDLMPIGGYPETAALGTVLLWLTLRIVHEPLSPRARSWHLAAIGLIAGLAYWTDWLILPYFVVVALYLLLDDWRLPARPAAWAALCAFALGSLPFWRFNLRHHFSTFELLDRQATVQDPGPRLRWGDVLWVSTHGLSRVLGLDGDFTSARLGQLLFFVAAIAVLTAAVALRHSWKALLRGRVREASPVASLVLLGLFTAVIYAECRPTTLQLERFLMPMTTSTIPLLALGIVWLDDRSRLLGSSVLVALVAFYGSQIVAMHDHFAAPWPRFWAGPVDGLSNYLLHSPIRFAYADYGDAAITTFLTRDQVVVADYRQWRYPLREVDFRDPAVIVDGRSADTTLAALDARFSVAEIPGYAIYWPIRYDGVPRAPLPRDRWRVMADVAAEDVGLMTDGDPLTAWSAAGDARHPSIVVDLGDEETVTGVSLDAGDREHDIFHRLRIERSTDGQRWEPLRDAQWDFPLHFDSRGQISTRPVNVQDVLFPPVSTRWLRLTLLDHKRSFRWSIGELAIFGLGKTGALFEAPKSADPQSPQLVERRLRLQAAREPQTDRALLELAKRYLASGNVQGAAEVDRLRAEHFTPGTRTDWTFGRDLALLGYDWRDLGQRRFEMTYYWRCERKLFANYAVIAHLDGSGHRFQDDYVLGAPDHLTSTWQPGEIVKEVHEVTIPATIPDGVYALTIGTWDPLAKRHLPLGPWWHPRQTAELLRVEVSPQRLITDASR